MIKQSKGKQSVSVGIGENVHPWDKGVWFFCQDWWQSKKVDISVDQFDMIKTLVNDPSIIKYYEDLRLVTKK